jgi:hypothetical protein
MKLKNNINFHEELLKKLEVDSDPKAKVAFEIFKNVKTEIFNEHLELCVSYHNSINRLLAEWHKDFRQIDVTLNGDLDMLCWHVISWYKEIFVYLEEILSSNIS